MTKQKLIAKAEAFADKWKKHNPDFDAEENVYEFNEGEDRVFEDDANIHVVRNGVRVCIGFDQTTTRESVLDHIEKDANRFFSEPEPKSDKAPTVRKMTPAQMVAYLRAIEHDLSLSTNHNKAADKAYQRIIDRCAFIADKLEILTTLE